MVDNYGLSAILQYVRLSELDDFDELFYYDGKLGPLYQKEKTTFKVWAPTALEVMVKVGNEAYQMERKEKGVFEVTIQGDLDNQEYNYLIRHHKSFHETLDLYAYASNANSNSNIVIDVDKINEPLYLENLPHMKRKTEAIIYELSVRDFTMSKTINATHPGTFMSLVESGLVTPQGNKAGFDYLVDLGVTHVDVYKRQRLMRMLVVPLVFCSIVCGSMAVGDTKKLGAVGLKTMLFYLCTTALAVVVALCIANVINPGIGLDMSAIKITSKVTESTQATSVTETLLNIIPTNIFESLANGTMLQIILFALILGVILANMSDRVDIVKNFFSQFNDIMMEMTMVVMKLSLIHIFMLLLKLKTNVLKLF